MKSYTQIPPGTQIVIGCAARRRRVLERTICSVFEGWSYEEIIPPIFDYYDVFVKGMGSGPEEQIYRFIDRDGMEFPADQVTQLKDVLNVKDQSGLEALLEHLPLGDRRKKILRAVPHLTGDKAVIAEARELVKNPRSVDALDHLEEIYSIFERLDLAQHLTIDLGEIRGFDYYSGILFRAYVRDLGFEVASGGRYDGLPAAFGEDLPAVG